MEENIVPDDASSFIVDLSNYDTHGLCSNYTLRRHKYENEANIGCYEARSDWIKLIGPTEKFGNCNPINGNFTAVVLPLCRPDRLRLVAYVIEYAFLYDDMVELQNASSQSSNGDPETPEWTYTNPALGKTQFQAKIMTQLLATDKVCTKRVQKVWQEMLTTTVQGKDKQFSSLAEYLDFRNIDTGSHFVESLLLYGMGITLTEEEDAQFEALRYPCHATMGLANDFLSFDREFAEFKESGESQPFPNAVWLHVKWHNVDVETAKSMVLKTSQRYEAQFLDMCAEYRRKNSPLEDRLDRYLRALTYQVSGNVVWSLNCPRYFPELRYDPNAGLENALTAEKFYGRLSDTHVPAELCTTVMDHRLKFEFNSSSKHQRGESTDTTTTTEDDSRSLVDDSASVASSRTSYAADSDHDDRQSKPTPEPPQLDDKHARAPFEYITSLPSKGARDTFIDALNVWLAVPEPTVSRIKALVSRLHSASLMLDDIEDGSDLRRGQPATHEVFGVAQTINSGGYEIVKAVGEAAQLGIPSAVGVTVAALEELHIGQSYDLYWTRHVILPSEDEYLDMVDKKTGGLFRLLARLMIAAAPAHCNKQLANSIETLVSLLGVQFQIRDDYQNLQSADYADQKGFCEDLDEGKFSFPLIHAFSCKTSESKLRELLKQLHTSGGLSQEHKALILKELEDTGSLQYTREALKRRQGETSMQLDCVERTTGSENWILRSLLRKLEV